MRRAVILNYRNRAIAYAFLIGMTLASNVDTLPAQVSGIYPPGGTIGVDVEVSLRGSTSNWPVEFWCDREGIEFVCQETEGKVVVSTSPDAQPGVYLIRVIENERVSSLLPFYMEWTESMEEVEPNNAPSQATECELPIAVFGRLDKNEEVDSFLVRLDAGETIVATAFAHRPFGSPMDTVMQVCNQDGIVLSQVDDELGLDPQITFTPEASGQYLIRLFAFPETPNSSIRFAGAETFIYRLEITNKPRLAFAYQAEGNPSLVQLLPTDSSAVSVESNQDVSRNSLSFFSPELSGVFETDRVDDRFALIADEAALSEVRDLAESNLPPLLAWGSIRQKAEIDRYRVNLTKDESIRVSVHSRRFRFAMDPYLRIVRPDGSEFQAVDDVGVDRDAVVDFVVPETGEYVVEVSDSTYGDGPRHLYRLMIDQIRSSYRLTAETDQFAVTDTGEASLAIKVQRDKDFQATVEFQLVEAPEGVELIDASSVHGEESAEQIVLAFTTSDRSLSGPVTIAGETSDGDTQFVTFAVSSGHQHRQLWLTVNRSDE